MGHLGKEKDNTKDRLSDSARISNSIRTILLSLFALIGFIILVFAIFIAVVRVELAQIATGVFIVALIGSYSRGICAIWGSSISDS